MSSDAKPALKITPDGFAVEIPVGDGVATVQLNEQAAKEMVTRLGEFSRNPETRKRFVVGVLKLFMEATKDGPDQ